MFWRRIPFQVLLFLLLNHILGGTCAAWFGKDSTSAESQREGNIRTTNNQRSPLNADLFGSVCYTFQQGQFRKLYGDLTRVDARLDIFSLSSFAKRVFKSSSRDDNSLSSPRLNLIFQQQVILSIPLLECLFCLKNGKWTQMADEFYLLFLVTRPCILYEVLDEKILDKGKTH